MPSSCLRHTFAARGLALQLLASACAILLFSSPVISETSFPCDLFFDVSSAFSDGPGKGMQCVVRFFCTNASSACGCSDASQPMFSFDVPFSFAAADDIQSGIESGDVTIQPGKKDNATDIAAAFDAVNQTEGGMCAPIYTGFSLKMKAQHENGRVMHSLLLSVLGQNCDAAQDKFTDTLTLSALSDPPERTPVNIVSLVPVRSKLAIPATASFQITLNNLAAVGSPLYVMFNRASDPSHPSDAPMRLWELDGWWQPPDVPSVDNGLSKTQIAIGVVVAFLTAVVIYRYFCSTHGRERRSQLKMTTARMRNLFARNLHKRAERKEREREERKPIFQEDEAPGTSNSMDMNTFLDIGADDEDEAPGRGAGRT